MKSVARMGFGMEGFGYICHYACMILRERGVGVFLHLQTMDGWVGKEWEESERMDRWIDGYMDD